MKHNRKDIGIIMTTIVFSLGIMFLISTQNDTKNITGYFYYSQNGLNHYISWDFSNESEYSYEPNLINLSEGEAKIIPTTSMVYWNTTTTIQYSLVSALYDPSDATDKIRELDNKKQETNENKILDVFFGNQINNGGVLSIYINEGQKGHIYLCDKGMACSSSNHGSVYYDSEEGWYNITVEGLNSPTNIFNIHPSDNIKINYITSSEGEIIKALYNPENKTDKAKELDDKKQEVHKNKIFNLLFESQLNNNDIISLYIEDGSATELFLCDYGDVCFSPGYGSVDYDGEEGWYNITIGGLDSPTNSFNLEPDKVKINYIKAASIETQQHSHENISYPSSAEILTDDIKPSGIYRWEMFSKEETLNSQSINYSYSLDSGATWGDMPEDNDLSSISTGSGKIRFKAILISDGTNTPILNKLSLNYTTEAQACTENWTLNYGECSATDNKLKYYSDYNNCSTANNLPSDNGTYVECDYCTPNWSCGKYGVCHNNNTQGCITAIDINNCSGLTGEITNYSGDYSEFIIECDGSPPKLNNVILQPQVVIRGENLNITVNISDENQVNLTRIILNQLEVNVATAGTLDNSYFDLISWQEGNNIIINTAGFTKGIYSISVFAFDSLNNSHTYENVIKFTLTEKGDLFHRENIYNVKNASIIKVDGYNETSTVVEIIPKNDMAYTSVVLNSYNITPINATENENALHKYIDIEMDEESKGNISGIIITIHYTDEETEMLGIDENTLNINYYNETAKEWEELNSTVNTTGNYVSIEVEHLSLYGVFGSEKTVQQQSSPVSTGGSGGSRRRAYAQITPNEAKKDLLMQNIKAKENIIHKKEISEENIGPICNYTADIIVSNPLSFLESDSAFGMVVNRGDCDIKELSLTIEGILAEKIVLPKERFIDIKKGSQVIFEILSKKHLFKESGLTGFTTKSPSLEKIYNGNLKTKIITSTDNATIILKNSPLSIKVREPDETIQRYGIKELSLISLIIITAIIAIYKSYIYENIPKKRKKRSKY